MPVEIGRAAPGSVDAFFKTNEREALKSLYEFSVIWHEQSYDFSATEDGEPVGAANVRIAASPAHVERVVVLPERRRAGIGRGMLDAAADVASTTIAIR